MNSHFGELTPRMKQFREELLAAQPQVCVERALITTQVYRDNQDQPLALKRALMLKAVLERMTIFIEPQTATYSTSPRRTSRSCGTLPPSGSTTPCWTGDWPPFRPTPSCTTTWGSSNPRATSPAATPTAPWITAGC